MACRLHITGASGAGTTTLGRALATHWSVPHADADDYFWLPTTPPYVDKRPEADRLRLMADVFVGHPAWVLSGSLAGWGDSLTDRFEAVVFLALDPEIRLGRLREREAARYGEAIQEGGEMEQEHREFLTWAAGYDDPAFSGRNLARHQAWLAELTCPVLRLNSARPVQQLVGDVETWLGARPAN